MDPDEAEAHLALGHVHFANREIDRAIPEVLTAINLNPSYASAHHLFGTLLSHIGRADEAQSHISTAIKLSPKDGEIALFHARATLVNLYLRRHEEAVEWGRKAVRGPAIQWPAHCFLVAALAHLDRKDEASKAVEDLMAFRPGITLSFVRENYPTVNRDDFDHFLDGLRNPCVFLPFNGPATAYWWRRWRIWTEWTTRTRRLKTFLRQARNNHRFRSRHFGDGQSEKSNSSDRRLAQGRSAGMTRHLRLVKILIGNITSSKGYTHAADRTHFLFADHRTRAAETARRRAHGGLGDRQCRGMGGASCQ